MGLEMIDRKGDVTFWKDEKGVQFQKLAHGEPFKVRNGKMTYKRLATHGRYIIKYNNNGTNGFSVWKGTVILLESWKYAMVDSYARGLNDSDRIKKALS